MRRLLLCRLLRRHDWVRVFDDVSLEAVSVVGIRGRVLRAHRECRLCPERRSA